MGAPLRMMATATPGIRCRSRSASTNWSMSFRSWPNEIGGRPRATARKTSSMRRLKIMATHVASSGVKRQAARGMGDGLNRQGDTVVLYPMHDDLKAAIRSLKSSKTFTAVALIVLALGIGASTAIFSVVDAVVLRGLPFDEHDRLVAVGERRPPGVRPDPNRDTQAISSAAPQNYLDWAAQQQVFESMAAYAGAAFTLRDPGAEPEDLRGQRTTADFFK